MSQDEAKSSKDVEMKEASETVDLGLLKDDKELKEFKNLKEKSSSKSFKDLKDLKDSKEFKETKGLKLKNKVVKEGKKDKVVRDKKKRKPKKRESWGYYIQKVLKTVHEDDCGISKKAVECLDSFTHDLFERISSEASRLLRMNKKRTLTSMEAQTAARLVLPGELCKHAIQDGHKAVNKYQLANGAGDPFA